MLIRLLRIKPFFLGGAGRHIIKFECQEKKIYIDLNLQSVLCGNHIKHSAYHGFKMSFMRLWIRKLSCIYSLNIILQELFGLVTNGPMELENWSSTTSLSHSFDWDFTRPSTNSSIWWDSKIRYVDLWGFGPWLHLALE